MRIFYLILISLLILCSCETPIDIEIPKQQPQLVAQCRFTVDGYWQLSLFQTKHILKAGHNQSVDNADVKIFEGDQVVETLTSIGEGIYEKTGFQAEVNHTYTLKINAPGFPQIQATDKVYEKPELKAVFLDTHNVKKDFENFHDSQGYSLAVEFNDKKEMENFYELVVLCKYKVDDGQFYDDYVYFEIDDKLLGDTELWYSSDYQGRMPFSDLTFNGTNYKLKIVVDSYCVQFGSEITVTLNSVSEDYVRNRRSRVLHEETEGPFDETIQVYSNIENGFGIFAGYNSSNLKIKL